MLRNALTARRLAFCVSKPQRCASLLQNSSVAKLFSSKAASKGPDTPMVQSVSARPPEVSKPVGVAPPVDEGMNIGVLAFLTLVGGYGAYLLYTIDEPSPDLRDNESVRTPRGNYFRTSNGALIEYFVFGKHDASRTLLALPDANQTGDMFADLALWALDNDLRVVAPTLPGFGLTSRLGFDAAQPTPPRGSEARKLSSDVALWRPQLEELVAHLKLEHFHVLGLSLGAVYAADVLQNSPLASRIDAAMLYTAFAPKDPAGGFDPLVGSQLEAFARLNSVPLLKRFLERYLLRPTMDVLPTADVVRSVKYQWEGLSSYTDIIDSWRLRLDSEGLASSLSQAEGAPRRVVIVGGRQDTVAPPANQLRLNELVPGSELIWYEGAHEKPVQNTRLLEAHVAHLLAPVAPLDMQAWRAEQAARRAPLEAQAAEERRAAEAMYRIAKGSGKGI